MTRSHHDMTIKLAKLASILRTRHYKHGTIIVKEGEVGSSLFYIRRCVSPSTNGTLPSPPLHAEQTDLKSYSHFNNPGETAAS